MTDRQKQTANSVYKILYKLYELPIKNLDDAKSFVNTCAQQQIVINKLLIELRGYAQNNWDPTKYNYLNACECTNDGLKLIITWYDSAVKFTSLTDFSDLQVLRGFLDNTLDQLKNLCTFEFIRPYLSKEPSITDENSLVEYWLNFLRFSSKHEALYMAIFGTRPTELPHKITMRLNDILMGTDSGNLTRTEQVELSEKGFTRESLKKFLSVIETRALNEPQPEFRELYKSYLDDICKEKIMQKHLELV